MALVKTDPSLPSNPAPIFADTDAARGDQLRANNGDIWLNLQELDNDIIANFERSIYGDNAYGSTLTGNFNAITKSGFYTGYGTATGAPTSSYAWFILHQNSAVGSVTAYQRAIAFAATPIIYERTKIGSSWNAWTIGGGIVGNAANNIPLNNSIENSQLWAQFTTTQKTKVLDGEVLTYHAYNPGNITCVGPSASQTPYAGFFIIQSIGYRNPGNDGWIKVFCRNASAENFEVYEAAWTDGVWAPGAVATFWTKTRNADGTSHGVSGIDLDSGVLQTGTMTNTTPVTINYSGYVEIVLLASAAAGLSIILKSSDESRSVSIAQGSNTARLSGVSPVAVGQKVAVIADANFQLATYRVFKSR